MTTEVQENGTAYASLTKKYVKGKIPFRIWFFSSLVSALSVVVDNVTRDQAPLMGFFSVFFLNLGVTIPLFLAQAHFVGLALQRKPKTARTTLIVTLILGWTITAAALAFFLHRIYEGTMNEGALLMIINYAILVVNWIFLSLLTFKVHRVKTA